MSDTPLPLCRDCQKHAATILNFCEGALDFVHGMAIHLCQCCYVKRIEKAYAPIQENLRIQKAKLEETPCE